MRFERGRGDAENVFDELKNQWGFNGFCSHSKRVTALAARLLLLIYNPWNLFLRLMHPREHIEAVRGRRWFLLIAARLVESGRQKTMHVAVTGAWWKQLSEGYQRVLLAADIFRGLILRQIRTTELLV